MFFVFGKVLGKGGLEWVVRSTASKLVLSVKLKGGIVKGWDYVVVEFYSVWYIYGLGAGECREARCCERISSGEVVGEAMKFC